MRATRRTVAATGLPSARTPPFDGAAVGAAAVGRIVEFRTCWQSRASRAEVASMLGKPAPGHARALQGSSMGPEPDALPHSCSPSVPRSPRRAQHNPAARHMRLVCGLRTLDRCAVTCLAAHLGQATWQAGAGGPDACRGTTQQIDGRARY